MLTLYTEMTDHLNDDLAIERANLAYEKAVLAYETFMQVKDLKIREAELTCIQESGDFDRLVSLYEDVEKETEKKENGLVQNIWAAIKNIIKKIKETLFGKKAKDELHAAVEDDPDGEIEAPSIFKTVIDALKGSAKDIASFIYAIPKNIKDNKAWTAAAIVSIGTAGGFAMTKIKKKDAEGVIDTAETVINAAEDLVNRYSNGDNNENKSDNKDAGSIQKAIGLVRSIVDWLSNKIKAGWDKAKEVVGNAKGKLENHGGHKAEKDLTDGMKKQIDNLNSTIEKKESELANAQSDIEKNRIQKEIDDFKSQLADIEGRRQGVENAKNNSKNKKYDDDLKKKAKNINTELGKLNSEMNTLKTALHDAKEKLKESGKLDLKGKSKLKAEIQTYEADIKNKQTEIDNLNNDLKQTGHDLGGSRVLKSKNLEYDNRESINQLKAAVRKGDIKQQKSITAKLLRKEMSQDRINQIVNDARSEMNANESVLALNTYIVASNELVTERWLNDLQMGDVFAESATDALFELAEML